MPHPSAAALPTELGTPRVWLRPPRGGDIDGLVALAADPDVARYAGLPVPFGRRAAADLVAADVSGGARTWVVTMPGAPAGDPLGEVRGVVAAVGETAAEGRHAGPGDEPADPDRVVSVRYWVAARWRRRGLASTALELVAEAALRSGFTVVRLDIAAGNAASRATAKRCDFRRVAVHRGGRHAAGGSESVEIYARESRSEAVPLPLRVG